MEEAGTKVIGKLLDLLFSATKEYIDCVRNSAENVEKLKNEAQNLKDMKGRIQQRIHIAKGKGDTLLAGVQNWMDKVDDDTLKVEEFLDEEAHAKKTCLNLKLCVNISTLHHYSKMAADKTRFLRLHHEDGKTYESCVSIPTPAPRSVDLYQSKNLENIDTQKLTLGEIVTAINDESIQIVGIYGLGGVGKSTLANEVAAKLKNQFANIVFVTVSQTVNVKEIQNNVADAAKQIMNREKVLIILDDIWEELVLSDLGIPCGNDHMNCKILLTSRSKNVCEAMNAQSNICVNTLTDEEAWILLKRAVGERVDTDVQLNKLARKLIQECGGLPLIIQTVGKALKNKGVDIWEAALDRLQNHAPLDIAPEIRKAFMHLKLSYDLLESEEAKSCFLLCSMFKEDETIELRTLAEYGVGLGIFNDLQSINDAENRVQIAVDILKSSFLLLPDEKEARMHDVVRDVALLIGKGEFFVKSGKDLTEWQPRNNSTSQSYTRISLMDNRICKLPDYELHFPLVDTFLVQNNKLSVVPDGLFRGMQKVKVLDMSHNDISSIPQSIKLLTTLVTLDLSFNEYVREISSLGELKLLEILKLRGTGVGEIPDEIGQLTNLRLLDVYDIIELSIVKPGVLSKLTWLEELCIGLNYNWDGIYNCVLELSNLKSFKTLHLNVASPEFFPKGTSFETLTRFVIIIGDTKAKSGYQMRPRVKRVTGFANLNIMALMPFKKLIQVSDAIELESIEDMHNILPDLYEENFDDLKCIFLENCENVSCLVVTRGRDGMLSERKSKDKFFSQVGDIVLIGLPRLKHLWDCPHEYISFRNLLKIYIYRCSSLLMLFPVSVAQGLTNLNHLEISGCDSLVDVISGGNQVTSASEIEQTDDANIVFPRLETIYLCLLPKLESFYSGNSTIKYPYLESIHVESCPSMKRWAYGVHDMPKINFGRTPCSINDIIALHHQTDEWLDLGTHDQEDIQNEKNNE